MKATVIVTLKPTVLDPQGMTIQRSVAGLGMAGIRDVRQGPDGYLYLAVERDQQGGPGSARQTPNGSILRIEPAN